LDDKKTSKFWDFGKIFGEICSNKSKCDDEPVDVSVEMQNQKLVALNAFIKPTDD